MTFSEREFISRIRAQSSSRSNGLVTGIGDDCAVFSCCENDREGKLGLITSDALVDSIHFDLSWHPAQLLGRKSLSVNISDIAAMGGRPLHALLTVGFPGSDMSGLAEDFMNGFYEVLGEHDMALIGGDTVRSEKLFLSVTVMGDVSRENVVHRSGAQVGDDIWVSGFLGHAAAGLELCRQGFSKDAGSQKMIEAHLDPKPQVFLGGILGASGMVTAMMDVSDGVATDLSHLCAESSVGAEIEADMIPLSAQIIETAQRLQCSPLDWALKGGEDYQLLFTASAGNRETLAALVQQEANSCLFRIGRIVQGEGVRLSRSGKQQDVSYGGFDHFGLCP